MFQGEKDIPYKEGLIGLRMPVTGRSQLFDRVSEEWRKTGETAPINVSVYDLIS